MVHFFFRVVFLAELEHFEIMKKAKKRFDLHRPVYFLREGDHIHQRLGPEARVSVSAGTSFRFMHTRLERLFH